MPRSARGLAGAGLREEGAGLLADALPFTRVAGRPRWTLTGSDQSIGSDSKQVPLAEHDRTYGWIRPKR